METAGNRGLVAGIAVVCVGIGLLIGLALREGQESRPTRLYQKPEEPRYQGVVKRGDFRVGDGSMHRGGRFGRGGSLRAGAGGAFWGWEERTPSYEEGWIDERIEFTPGDCQNSSAIDRYSQTLPESRWFEFETYCHRLGFPLG